MTVALGESNFQSKHHLICRTAKVKAATSAHSMADIIPVLNFCFESNNSIKPNDIYFINNKRIILVKFSVHLCSTAFGE